MSRAYIVLQTRRLQRRTRWLHRRQIRDLSNPFELPNEEFRRVYRVSKEMALYICDELEVDLRPKPTFYNDGLPVHIKVLTCIKILGDGGYQLGAGQDHTLCIGQTTVSRYLSQFTEAVQRRLIGKWILFPGKYGVPFILGCIDCTQVKIAPPPFPHGVQYINRKGVHSINVQLVCDVSCKIIAVNARFPGSTHDQFIFNASCIKNELASLYDSGISEYFLLGDSGYALEPWVMTPVLNAAPNSPEERYTNWHVRVRNTVERTNGYLKNVFRCLGHDRALHYSPEKASAVINTCCVLYNIMHHFRLFSSTTQEVEVEEPEGRQLVDHPTNRELHQAAELKRNSIINTYFT